MTDEKDSPNLLETLNSKLDGLLSKVEKLISLLERWTRIPSHLRYNAALGGIVVASWWVLQKIPPPFLEGYSRYYSAGIAAVGLIIVAFFSKREPKPSRGTPNRLRGLYSYTERDGSLFSRLERQREIDLCEQHLNAENQPLLVLYGVSGSGKTSLLRAGLKFRLGHPTEERPSDALPTHCVYWQANEQDAAVGLAAAIDAETKLVSAGDPTAILQLATSRTVIIIDHFERLERKNPKNEPIFDLIKGAWRKPDHRLVQLVIAFRADYFPEWLEFQSSAGIGAKKVPIPSFTLDEAVRVMKVILADAKIKVPEDIVGRYINEISDRRSVSDQQDVSPVGIGILAMAFSTWSDSNDSVPLQSYASDGIAAILSAHMRQRLGPAYIPAQDRDNLLRALITTLVERDNDIQQPQGASLEELATASGISPNRMKGYLEDLTDGRILDEIPLSHRFVLAHDRLIPILRQQAQNVTNLEQSIVDQYLLWQEKKKSKQHLLRGRRLRWMIGDPRTFFHGPDEPNRRGYIALSKAAQRRRYIFGSLGVICMLSSAVIVGLYVKVTGAKREIAVRNATLRNEMVSSHLPADLFENQAQLQSLTIDDAAFTNLKWLHSTGLAELNFASAKLESLDGLESVHGLRSLHINLNSSALKGIPLDSLSGLTEVRHLHSLTLDKIVSFHKDLRLDFKMFPELESLSLDYEGSKITVLPDLSALQNLKYLQLNLKSTDISVLPDLSQLPRLTSLVLFLDGSKINTLEPLSKLEHLESLAISGDERQIEHLRDLKASLSSYNLIVYRGSYPVSRIPNFGGMGRLNGLSLQLPGTRANEIPRLSNLGQVPQLTMCLTGSNITSLPDLANLTGMRRLSLGLESTAITELQVLESLHKLERLTLNLNSTGVKRLPEFSKLKQLKELHLLLKYSYVSSLSGLRNLDSLETLVLDISGSRVDDLSSISQIKSLKKLTIYLRWSQIPDLPDLSLLKNLTSLELDFDGLSGQSLPDLSHLQNLTNLTLDIGDSHASVLPDLSGLPQLSTLVLKMKDAEIEDLSSLEKIDHLSILRLDLRGSAVRVLPNLTRLASLRSVVLDISHSRITDLSQIQNMSKVEELTVDRDWPLLKGMPTTVRILRISTEKPDAPASCEIGPP